MDTVEGRRHGGGQVLADPRLGQCGEQRIALEVAGPDDLFEGAVPLVQHRGTGERPACFVGVM